MNDEPQFNAKSVTILHGFFGDEFFEDLLKKPLGHMVVLEGRPTLAASKALINALVKRKVKPFVIADNMAGFLFFQKYVKRVCVSYQSSSGADIVAPIGSLVLAVLCDSHKVPMDAYPSNREQQPLASPNSVYSFNGARVAPRGAKAYAPLLEEIPNKLIRKIYE
ncbi:MAG: hypothetical protein KC713_06650 [Candidatus Omnitrophica bacterium]|nr:hypothetical protein [Candidatus Omnitrophota bacterium]